MVDKIESFSKFFLYFLYPQDDRVKFPALIIVTLACVIFSLFFYKKKKEFSTRAFKFLALGIILFSILLKFFALNEHYIGHNSFRQTQTLTVARNYYEDNMDITDPQLDFIFSDQEEYIGEVDGFELNILPYMLAAISKVTGWTNIVPRLLIISFSTLGTIAMLIISRRLFSRPVALASTFLFSVLPLTVYYGQAFMPDFPSISLMLSSIAFLIIRDKYKNYYRLFMILSLVALILGVLIKLQHVFFVPVVFFFLINKRIEFKLPFKAKEFLQEVMAKDILKKFVFFILGPVIIVLGYYVFDYKIDPSYKYPHGNLIDPLLFLRGTNRNGINFYEMSLGYIHYVAISIIGFLLFIIGISSKLKGDIKLKKITNAFIYIWIITIVAFYVVFSGGAIINLYYMIFALPILVLGIGYFFELLKKNNLFYIVPIFIIIVVSGTSDYTRGWLFNLTERFDAVVLGNLIQENTNDDESIIVVDYVTYEPTNLYHTNRKGWVVGEGELSIINIEEYKKKGAAGVGISARFIAGIRNNEELYGYLFTLRNVSYQDNYFFFL